MNANLSKDSMERMRLTISKFVFIQSDIIHFHLSQAGTHNTKLCKNGIQQVIKVNFLLIYQFFFSTNH